MQAHSLAAALRVELSTALTADSLYLFSGHLTVQQARHATARVRMHGEVGLIKTDAALEVPEFLLKLFAFPHQLSPIMLTSSLLQRQHILSNLRNNFASSWAASALLPFFRSP